VKQVLLSLLLTCIFLSCSQQEKVEKEEVETDEIVISSTSEVSIDLATIFSKTGSKIPSSLYQVLGVKNQSAELFSSSFYPTAAGNQICVFSDLPSDCSDFYCYATYYVALVQNNSCHSLKSVPITLGSKPSVDFYEGSFLSISNEVEQYSSVEGSNSASITDNIVDFKKTFTIQESKLIEIQP